MSEVCSENCSEDFFACRNLFSLFVLIFLRGFTLFWVVFGRVGLRYVALGYV